MLSPEVLKMGENPFEGENVGIEHRLADNQTDSDIYASRDNGRYG
jgi:hypothetical protein